MPHTSNLSGANQGSPASPPVKPKESAEIAGQKRRLGKETDSGQEWANSEFPDSIANVASSEMPESKRRAQNRAAQRAFRERKEKHLKDLESRLAELESESRNWRLTNMALRSQLSLLENELQHYRNPVNPIHPANSVNSTHSASQVNLSPLNPPTPTSLHSQSGTHLSSLSTSSATPTGDQPSLLPGNQNHAGIPVPTDPANPVSPAQGTQPSASPVAPGPGNRTNSHVVHVADPNLGTHLRSDSDQTYLSHLNPNVPGPHSMHKPQEGMYTPESLLSHQHAQPQTQHSQHPSQDAQAAQPTPQPAPVDPVELMLTFDQQQRPDSVPTRAEEFCEKLSMACVPAEKPVLSGVPRIAAETSEWQPDSLFGQNASDWLTRNNSLWGSVLDIGPQDASQPQAERTLSGVPSQNQSNDLGTLFDRDLSTPSSSSSTSGGANSSENLNLNSDDNQLNLDFGNIASGGFGFQPANTAAGLDIQTAPDVAGLFGNDYSVFDPLDDLLTWEDPEKTHASLERQQQQVLQQQTELLQSQQRQNQQQLQSNQLSPSQPPQQPRPSQSPQNPHSPDPLQQPQTMQPGLSGQAPIGLAGIEPVGRTQSPSPQTEDESTKMEKVPATTQKFIPCSDVWDRICCHPKFGEIDINSMCSELRDKARCSKIGVVLDVRDVDDVLSSF